MITPLILIRPVTPAMKERKFGRIINITSTMMASVSKNKLIE
jgi:short-subunit dehydrogenase